MNAHLFCLALGFAAAAPPPSEVGVTAALGRAGLAPRTLYRGSTAYADSLRALRRVEASHQEPAAIVQPTTVDEVVTAVRVASAVGAEITVRGGGGSTLCTKTGAIVVDLRAHMRGVDVRNGVVRADGGATMGEVNAAAVAAGGAVPAGVSSHPGLGMALQGGVGHLTRRWGLTVDNIVAVEIVTGDGAVRRLDAESARGGEAAELWWGVRGAGPSLGVVVAIEFQLRPLPRGLWVETATIALSADALRAAHSIARRLSTRASLSVSATSTRATVYYAAAAPPLDGVASPLRSLIEQTGGWLEEGGGKFYQYNETPPVAAPFDGPHAGESSTPTSTSDAASSVRSIAPARRAQQRAVVAMFLSHPTAAVEAALVGVLRRAPAPSSDSVVWQHCGGAAAVPPSDATAFWPRDDQAYMLYGTCEWPVAASGARADVERASGAQWACDAWLDALRDAVKPITVGIYAVDIMRSGVRSAADVRSAFGANRFRLAALQRRVDPARVFSRSYYPLLDRAMASVNRGGHSQLWSDAAAQARFMERAIELAVAAQRSGGAPYGALIVDPRNGGRIVAEGANDAARNPIWHGEMAAITNLSALLDSETLLPADLGVFASSSSASASASTKSLSSVYAVAPGLELYTTAEPCSMCMSAIAWSGFGKVVYGTSVPYLIAHGVRQIDIRAAAIEARSGVVTKGRGVVVEGGVLARQTDLLYVRREGAASHHGHHHHGYHVDDELR